LASDVAEPGGFFFIGKIGKNLFAWLSFITLRKSTFLTAASCLVSRQTD
jgi:hypothetical protein